jgi:hypothetical protein
MTEKGEATPSPVIPRPQAEGSTGLRKGSLAEPVLSGRTEPVLSRRRDTFLEGRRSLALLGMTVKGSGW